MSVRGSEKPIGLGAKAIGHRLLRLQAGKRRQAVLLPNPGVIVFGHG
jgi:hypothetical protein